MGIKVVKKNCLMIVLHVSVEEFVNSSVFDIWYNLLASRSLSPGSKYWLPFTSKE
jgi:hypothetical protein